MAIGLKRSILVSFLVTGVLTGMIGISAYASTVKDELQKLRQAGIPTTVEELNLPEIPDEENGALMYREVFELMDSLGQKHQMEWDHILRKVCAEEWNTVPSEDKNKVVDLILQSPDFARIYQLLEKASRMECRFLTEEDYRKASAMLLPHLKHLRNCGRLLAAKAKIEAANGEIDKALSTSLTGLRIAKSLSNEPVLISQLIRIALDNITLANLEEILEKGEGSVTLYQSLIDEIKDERKTKVTHYALGEMVIFGMQEFPRLRKGSKEEFQEGLLWMDEMDEKEKEALVKIYQENPGKFWDEQQRIYLETMSKVFSLTEKPYLEVREQLERFDDELARLPKEKAILTQMLAPAVHGAYTQEARLDAMLGNAELALALKIYKAKNDRYPTELAQLVPGVIPELPKDPFTGKDYVYKKRDEGFIIYSLAENQEDDGGLKVKVYKGDYDIVWECGG